MCVLEELLARGERWFPEGSTFREDMPKLWGDWGVDSEVGKLRAVLMRRPGEEIEKLSSPEPYRWKALMDPELARAQQDALTKVYRDHGVEVYYAREAALDKPNSLYLRDIIFMTPEGAILGRPAMAARRGEERWAAMALGELGVPIVRTINRDGIFEGACCLWVDSKTAILGTGVRCNASGAAQVEYELRNMGVENIIKFQIPYGHAHVDGLMNMADRKKAVIFPWQVPYDVVAALKELDFQIIEAQSVPEVKQSFGINFVALEPGVVVMPAGNQRTQAAMEEAGIKVITVDVSEIMKGWGAIHCMTAFLRRDPI